MTVKYEKIEDKEKIDRKCCSKIIAKGYKKIKA
jgi:hypothetical protein